MSRKPKPDPTNSVEFAGPGRTAAVISWDGRLPAIIHLATRPSTSAPGRLRAAFIQPLADPATADSPIQAVPFADFRLEMN